MNNTKTLFVIPSLDGASWADSSMMPQTKSELAAILAKPVEEQAVKIREDISYRPLEITRWLKETEIYDLKLLPNAHFEPYFVAHRDIQYYDEIFNSYGLNKLSHVYDLRNLDYKLKMLPDVFGVHLSHKSLNQTDWSKGFGIHSRYTIKAGAFVARHTSLPGLLTNEYVPSYLKSYKMKMDSCPQRKCNTYEREELIGSIKTLRFTLYVSSMLSLVCVIMFVKEFFLRR